MASITERVEDAGPRSRPGVRGRWVRRLAVAALALAAGCERGSPAPRPGPRTAVTLQLNWVPEPEFGGIYAALADDLFRDHGLDVKVIAGGAGVATPQLVASGACDFGLMSADQLLQIRAQGGDVAAVYAIFQHSPVGIMVHHDNPARSLEALWTSRATVAVEPGLPYVKFLNRRYGGKDLTLVPYQGALAIFAGDPSLAQQCFVSAEPVQMELRGVPVRVFAVAESGYDPYAAVVATSGAAWRSHPERAKALVAALREGWRRYLDAPEKYNPAIAALNPAMGERAMHLTAVRERPFIETKWTQDHGLGAMDPERWRTLARQMKELGTLGDLADPAAAMVDASP